MSARSLMTMRAQVERSATGTRTDWGTDAAPQFVPAANDVPIRVWSKSRREARDDSKIATIEDMRGIAPIGADIQEGDRLSITNRLAETLFGGPLAVDSISRHSGAASTGSHLELMLVRHV